MSANKKVFTVRSALLLTVAVLAGIVIGALTYLTGQPVAAAVIAGLGAGAAVLVGADKLVAD